MMTKQKKMQPHNPNTKPPHSGVVWFLWYAADSARTLGQIVSIDYSDSTPDVAFTYDRLGRQLTVTDVLGTRTNVYSPPTSSKSATPTVAPLREGGCRRQATGGSTRDNELFHQLKSPPKCDELA